jgi:hypothetical protein
MRAPELSIPQIVFWLKERHERSGNWATKSSGRIPGSLGETWQKVELALRRGGRGLPFKSSLAVIKSEYCGVRNRARLPRLTHKLILEWADDHRFRKGTLPHIHSGEVLAASGETWQAIDRDLRNGCRGLRGGSSLARLLRERRGYRSPMEATPLTNELLLKWIDYEKSVSGRWPTRTSGPVAPAPGETWARISYALVQGDRGLAGGSSLARFLAKHRNVRNPKDLPNLRIKDIARWARMTYDATGRWPKHISGTVQGVPGETWAGVHAALRNGLRGLPGGSSLHQVLRRYFNVPTHRNPTWV